MFARRSYYGKFGRESIAVCVDLIWMPSGSDIESGDLVNFQLVYTIVSFSK